jgi:hypothetical protein
VEPCTSQQQLRGGSNGEQEDVVQAGRAVLQSVRCLPRFFAPHSKARPAARLSDSQSTLCIWQYDSVDLSLLSISPTLRPELSTRLVN